MRMQQFIELYHGVEGRRVARCQTEVSGYIAVFGGKAVSSTVCRLGIWNDTA
jgi:hypothetical protein